MKKFKLKLKTNILSVLTITKFSDSKFLHIPL